MIKINIDLKNVLIVSLILIMKLIDCEDIRLLFVSIVTVILHI